MLISVGEILDRSWHHYTNRFVELMSIAAWLLLAALINVFATWLYPTASYGIVAGLNYKEIFGVVLYAINFLVITPIVSIWVFNATVHLIDREISNQPIRLREISRDAWKVFFPRIWIGILGGLCVATPVLLVVPGFILSSVSKKGALHFLSIPATILFLLGLAGALIIGVKIAIRLFFSAYELILENKRGRLALRTSSKLVMNRWFPTLWRVILPKVVFFFGAFTIQMFLIFLLKSFSTNLAGLNFELGVRIYTIGSTTIFLVLAALLNPLVLTADYLLFRSLQSER